MEAADPCVGSGEGLSPSNNFNVVYRGGHGGLALKLKYMFCLRKGQTGCVLAV